MASSVFAPVDLIAKQHSCVVDFLIAQHSDWNDSFALQDGNAPFILTGVTLEMEIRPTFSHPARIAYLSSATGGIIIHDAPGGIVQIFVHGGDVALWPAGDWTHVMRALKSGEQREVARGAVRILPA